MKRAALLIVAVVSLLLALPAEQAEAFHGHHHGGWGGGGFHHGGWGGGYRHWGGGWGGYGGWGRGWGGYGYRSYYGGFGYRPYYGIGLGLGFGGYGLGYGGYGLGYGGYGLGGYYGGYYPSYYYSSPYYGSSSYFYGQSPYFYNSYYGYPSCSYTVPSINYYATTPVVNVTKIVVRKAAPPAPAAAPPAPAAAPRATTLVRSSITDRSRARQQIKLGDAAFLAGHYADALSRYRNATETAADYAEAHYRKGHAYVAVGKYDLAAASFRRGLELEPAARREGFRLDNLYGVKSKAKVVHLENLAAAALMREDVADNYFLLGLMLRFDGENERAERFLAKAASLSPAMRTAVVAILPDAKERPVSLPLGDEI
jgi:tetratricopeptide (TPR) repeat protein